MIQNHRVNNDYLNDHDYLKLPKKLLECCASISVRPNLLKEDIPSIMKQIVDVSVQTKSKLDDIEEIIENEHNYLLLKRSPTKKKNLLLLKNKCKNT